jgi:uncharacterized DUF497 family protein
MELEWDQTKRRRNVEDHGSDFLDGVLVLSGEYYCRYSPRQGEERWHAIRSVGGVEIAVAFTLKGERKEITCIISVRRGEAS